MRVVPESPSAAIPVAALDDRPRHRWSFFMSPRANLTLGAMVVAVILAVGVVAGRVPWTATTATTLVALVGATALLALVGKKA